MRDYGYSTVWKLQSSYAPNYSVGDIVDIVAFTSLSKGFNEVDTTYLVEAVSSAINKIAGIGAALIFGVAAVL